MKTLPRVAAIHDMSGYGKCSLTVAIPVLSAAGIEVCPLPTALLSTNTLFDHFTFHDFTPYMGEYIAHWQQLGLKFNSVYSGFLGSEEQIQIVMDFIENFDGGIGVIDPVMGDNGNIIKTYTQGMCDKMKDLVSVADLATPNITEACVLTGRPYSDTELGETEAKALCEGIAALGAKSVVLTGVVRKDKLFNCGIENGKDYFELDIDLLPFQMHGTGDLFASVLTGGLVRGHSLRDSVDSAAHFVWDAMQYSYDVEDAFDRGVVFEPFACHLGSGLYQR